MSRVFLLSPANCSGRRAAILMSPSASFDLAVRLRRGEATLADAFTFLSGLYFRGKIAYARAFANAPDPLAPLTGSGSLVITTNAGLRSPDTPITLQALRAFARCSIGVTSRTYRRALESSAWAVRQEAGEECEIVLLGSVASPKYVDVLLQIFGDRLCFPETFVGRGDMSRGGLMLRAAASGEELRYVPVRGAVLHGKRPPKLEKRERGQTPFCVSSYTSSASSLTARRSRAR